MSWYRERAPDKAREAEPSRQLQSGGHPRRRLPSMRTRIYAACLVQLQLAWAAPAHAQDATILVVAIVPPIVLAPLVLAFGRWFWLRGSSPPARILPLLVVSCVEVVLWVVLSVSTGILLTGDWSIGVIPWPVIAGWALWMLSRVWFDASRKAARWLVFLSPPVVLALLAAATWLVLLAVSP
jgi:hypothetical protein